MHGRKGAQNVEGTYSYISVFLCREEEAAKPSLFMESSLTPEQIANNLRDQIKRMKKRRQIVGRSKLGLTFFRLTV